MKFQCDQCKSILTSHAVTDGAKVTCPVCGAETICRGPWVRPHQKTPTGIAPFLFLEGTKYKRAKEKTKMSEVVKRPGFAIAAEILGYVSGGLFVLGALLGRGSESVFALLIGGGLIAMSVMMRKGKNWARITATALSGLLVLGVLVVCSDENIDDAGAAGCFILLAVAVCEIVFSWLPSVNKWFGIKNSRPQSSNV